MLFSSYIFVFVFLPVVIAVYYTLSLLKDGVYQRIFLIAASLFFYGYYNVAYLCLILASMGVNYVVARILAQYAESRYKVVSFIVGVAFNVLLLGYFKYYDFFVHNINVLLGTEYALRHIVLPLGISFFTFQQVSFLVSVYKGEEPVGRLKDYCLFVTFFPQLVAGPIVLYSEMMPQFEDDMRRKFNSYSFASGVYMFSMGLFKKAVIADSLAVFADNGFGMGEMGLAAGWLTSLSYTLQIYFDFSGYSDMAVGLGRMFNIEIPFNFMSPYMAESITDFWRRWHITLGRALSTYVYKPLGGNRKGICRTSFNLFITFFISGLWHGAAWTFVVWGALHGMFVVVERILSRRFALVPKLIRISVTFIITNFLWVLFRADSFSQAIKVYTGMVNFGNLNFNQLETVVGTASGVDFPMIIDAIRISVIIVGLLLVVFFCKNSATLLTKFVTSRRVLYTTAVMFVLSTLCLSRESVFIYFNF